MYRLLFIIGLLSTALAKPFNDTALHSGRIVGGYMAKSGQFPFIVSIRITKLNAHFCGGSIISPRVILTAGHCVAGNVEVCHVVTGVTTLTEQGDSYPVEEKILHENFSPNPLQNDVALLKLSTNIQFGPLVQPIALCNYDVYVGQPLTVIGWGQIDAHSGLSNDLKYLPYPVIDINECRYKLAQVDLWVADGVICTYSAPNSGSCNGDSGGPLIDEKGSLVGIVSWGIPCAQGFPDMYTHVGSFLNWIMSH